MKKKTKKRSFVHNPKKAKRSRRRVAFKSNPSRRRVYRKNPGDSIKDIAMLTGAAVGAAVLVPKIASKLPIQSKFVNIGMVAAGAALAIFGRRKPYLIGAGAGLAVAGASRLIVSQVPALAGDGELSQEQQEALLLALAEQDNNLEGESFAGESFAGESFAGDMNNPSM